MDSNCQYEQTITKIFEKKKFKEIYKIHFTLEKRIETLSSISMHLQDV